MKSVLSIDWLQFWCVCACDFRTFTELEHTGEEDIFARVPFEYKLEDHGTRQFKELWSIYRNGDLFAQVQAVPNSTKLFDPLTVSVKFANRLLYTPNLWDDVERFLSEHRLTVNNIERCDICCDFTAFADGRDPVQFITQFLSGEIRHVGQGRGCAYFNHGAHMVDGISVPFINYNGLSFGSHSSDVRVYLYNKSLELREEKDKPYIRDTWRKVGLIEVIGENKHGLPIYKDVWRLEVSIKSKGMKFVDKSTGEKVTICKDYLKTMHHPLNTDAVRVPDLNCIYFSFVRKLFCFIPNRPGITNITREKEKNAIQLFDECPILDRAIIREKSCSNRAEKILIHSLWNVYDKYRGLEDITSDRARSFAHNIARAVDLDDWLKLSQSKWEKEHHK